MPPFSSITRLVAPVWLSQVRLLIGWLLLSLPLTSPLLAQPVLVKDINLRDTLIAPGNFTNVNGTLFFTATNGTSGSELWKSDGTAAGTVLVKDIDAGYDGSGPGNFTNVNGTLFFTATNGTSGSELWKSDGTAAGTLLVKDIPYSGSSGPETFTNVNGRLFFTTFGFQLWKSDGTAAGTFIVKGFYPNYDDRVLAFLTNVNGTLFFRASDGTSGSSGLWKSDGTAAGTLIVKDIGAGYLTNVNGTLFFSANSETSSYELWKSDGTAAGTVLVKDIRPGFGGPGLVDLTNVNGTLFFTAYDGISGYELWKSDGTAAGTVLVKDIPPGSDGSGPKNFTTVNCTLYFRADNGKNGWELWKSNGTAAGTVLVKDILPGSNGSDPVNFTNVNGTLFFTANNGTEGYELWQSDGTSEGTIMVKDIDPGFGSSFPGNFTDVNGTLFFTADDGLRGRELWKYTPVEEPAPTVFRINAGGEAYTDSQGKAFIADQYSSSGTVSTQVTGAIANTQDDELYRQGRVGERFTYSLPTGNGVYYVVLHFAETYWGNQLQGGQGSRSFNVDIEELRKLTDYDIYAKAGGSLKAVQEAFRVVVKDSVLDIRFSKGSADLPLIAAIEVFAQDAFRINVAGSAYLSSKGWFLSDAYYGGGSVSAYAPGAVAGTEDDELYRSNRHSSLFNYNLPTGPGEFQVTLHFNEAYWGNLVEGGQGSRRFNVNAEGERKLSGYDTYQRAGEAMHAKQEQFTVTVTDQALSLAFLRGSSDNSVDFAHVAAIEVVRQGAATARLAGAGKTQPTAALLVYPNPVQRTLTVRLAQATDQIRATVVSDASGRRLLVNAHKALGKDQLQVDVSSLPKGLYFLSLDARGGSSVLKFLKQ